MFKFLIRFIFISLAFSNNDNIYSLISSPRNISIGGIHASSGNISSIFDSPIFLSNNNNNNIFLSIDKYSHLYNIYHLSYCIYANDKSNLLLGLVRREINNNFNTNSAWEDDGYPNLEDIDYTQIYNFQDKETGILIAYNQLIENNFIMGINFKPIFHRIDNVFGVGFSLDVRYLIQIQRGQISFGIDNLLAFKKWNTDLLEKYDLNGYLGSSINISDRNTVFYEYNINSGSKLGFEIELINNLFVRTGINKYNFCFGFGIQLENIKLDYAYMNNKSEILGSNHSVGFNINLDD